MGYNDSKAGEVLITGGYWSTNIGNSFFQLGGKYIMSKVLGRQVELFSDQLGYGRYLGASKPRNSLDLFDMVEGEYLVLQGSIFTHTFGQLWEKTFEKCLKRGVKIVLLGVGQFAYDKKEKLICREVLKKYRPEVFVSRDIQTFENFSDLCRYSYNGIDNAFFLPLFYEKMCMKNQKFMLVNFDKGPEPSLSFDKDITEWPFAGRGYNSGTVKFDGGYLNIDFSAFKRKISDLSGKYYGYFSTCLGLGRYKQARVGDYLIVRTDHQLNPMFPAKLFCSPNSFCMDIPYGYINLYANSALTLTDRIHSCIVTLAYGGQAMLFSKSRRFAVLERVNVGNIAKRPVRLDQEKLNELRNQELEFLKGVMR